MYGLDYSTILELSVSGKTSSGQVNQVVKLAISGDGGLDHYIEAFKALLVAAGFHPDMAAQLDKCME